MGEDDDFWRFVSEPFVATVLGQCLRVVSDNVFRQQLAQLGGDVHLMI